MKTRLLVFGVLCVSGLLLADVKYNYDPTADFAKYHTYQWVNLPTIHPDQLVDKQIRDAINQQPAAKGFTQFNSNPDIQVGYQIAVDREREWDAWGGGGLRFGGFASATSTTIEIGTLGIDFFDADGKSLVWRGTE